MKRIYWTMLFFYIGLLSFVLNAQVTIGDTAPPQEGALLDLKETGNSSSKGLLLPRVDLTHPNFLYPMFDVDGKGYKTDAEIQKQNAAHKGLVVYNMNDCLHLSGMDKGLYAWDGVQWINTQQQNVGSQNPLVKYWTDDRDGKRYAYKEFISIKSGGSKVSAGEWMLENLAFDPANNAYTNYLGYSFENKSNLTSPSSKYMYYPKTSADVQSPDVLWNEGFGYLYNYAAAINKGNESGYKGLQGVCPTGWHIPTPDEWRKLFEVIGTNPERSSTAEAVSNPTGTDAQGFYGTIVGAAMKAICEPYETPNRDSGGKSYSSAEGGFNAYLLGYNDGTLGKQYGERAMFHSSATTSSTVERIANVSRTTEKAYKLPAATYKQIAVRCIKDPQSNFSLICNTGYAHGTYRKGVALNSGNYIEIDVDVIEPGTWEITSNTVDNLSFNASGEFTTSGVQKLIVPGKGTPTTYEIKPIYLTVKSETQTSTCKVDVRMILPKRTVLGMGSGSWAIDYDKADGLGKFFQDSKNFGPNGRFKSDEIKLLTNLSNSSISVANLKPYVEGTAAGLNGKPVDIMIATYNSNFNTDDVADYLIDYIKKGGVFILFNEHMSREGDAVRLLQKLYPQGDGKGKKVNAVYNYDRSVAGGFVYQVPTDPNLKDDTILDGPFGNVRGKYIGEDNGYVDAVIRMPLDEMDWWIPAIEHSDYKGAKRSGAIYNEPGEASYTVENNANFPEGIFAFKAKRYNLFYCGDGGVASAPSTAAEQTHNQQKPFMVNSNNYPIPKQNYGVGSTKREVYNSAFVGNIIAWAVEQSVFNGFEANGN